MIHALLMHLHFRRLFILQYDRSQLQRKNLRKEQKYSSRILSHDTHFTYRRKY